VFHTEADFIIHIKNDHPASCTEINMPFLVARAQRPTLYPFTSCPFCETSEPLKMGMDEGVEKERELQKHIGIHLQNFSLFALLESEDDDSTEVVSNTGHALRALERSASNLSSIDLEFEDGGSFAVGIEQGKVPELEKGVSWDGIIDEPEAPHDQVLESLRKSQMKTKVKGSSL
jgi:hypothetical protein